MVRSLVILSFSLGSLAEDRRAAVLERDGRRGLQAFPSFDSDARKRKWNPWSYIDARDGAQAVRKALEARFTGFEAFIIANADTVMTRANSALIAEVFPGVEIRPTMSANGTLLSIDKARRMLGYHPQHSWRNHV